MATDTELLDFLQMLTDRAEYSGKCIMRLSLSGRGWRLHESNWELAQPSVRDAIEQFIDRYQEEKAFYEALA